MTIFRPCIDLHNGKVKQIVGGTWSGNAQEIAVNFTSEHSSGWYAERYKKDGLKGGHVIMLGPGNENAALEALKSYPGGMQLGGGITPDNAKDYLDAGASHVIVTSWVIPQERLDRERLATLIKMVGVNRLVLDLSCRKQGNSWFIAKDRWQTITKEEITPELLHELESCCDELLIHAADIEGQCKGIDQELTSFLGKYTNIPVTYAGGANNLADLTLVEKLSSGKVDLTIGSALDIFGGSLIQYQDCVDFNTK
ncbi:MAG: phosphoribosylformimino-5-aminoimidazole carboxamide ribotide isomerase [Fibrobacteria bacterium]|nr:phosphoribosylformimino-5-aminoimidazole carboxamide ribotide isomerase [Fibrobacteria bacterium]